MSEIKGLDSLMRKLNSLGGNLRGALEQAVTETTLVAEADARANAPVGGGSQGDSSGGGSLRGSITHEVKNAGDTIEGRVFSNAFHAQMVEFGTGPVGAANHAGISPNVSVSYTSRPFWVYPTVIGGEETFRRTSGQPARPYLYPAATENKDTFREITRKNLLKAIQEVAGSG